MYKTVAIPDLIPPLPRERSSEDPYAAWLENLCNDMAGKGWCFQGIHRFDAAPQNSTLEKMVGKKVAIKPRYIAVFTEK